LELLVLLVRQETVVALVKQMAVLVELRLLRLFVLRQVVTAVSVLIAIILLVDQHLVALVLTVI
jgi:hypothetical protein